MPDLVIIVPTRSRPEAVPRVVAAWHATRAFDDGAELLFVVDEDDPEYMRYCSEIDAAHDSEAVGLAHAPAIGWTSVPTWRPLVPKLNAAALAELEDHPDRFALGFAGDDHLPRTPHWAARYLEALAARGAGIVFCDDGYQGENIPTQWAMRAGIVRALGSMVPADVEHLYCDNVVRDLGLAAGCLTYLADVLIEHMHPVAAKGVDDDQYQRVNSRQQYRRDRPAYRAWRDNGGLARDAATVARALRTEGESA